MPVDPRSDALQVLSPFLVAEASVEDALQQVARLAAGALPAQAAGISMLGEDARPTTAIATDPLAPAVDRAQYDAGRGPCLDAWRGGTIVRVDDLTRAVEYPEFGRAAQRHGILSSLSLPLVAGDESIGALNLYAPAQHAFDETAEALGLELAAAAAVVLANATAFAVELGENLTAAMQSRAVIEQAKGMLMAWSPGLGPDAAFDVLRRASQRENRKLRDVARSIVEGRVRPPELDG